MQTISHTKDTSFTFKVDDVKIAQKAPEHLTKADALARRLKINGKFEDFSHKSRTDATFVNGSLTGFILALHTAYQYHYPLKLSVSDFIILIGQGLSKHINNNAEELRYEFVTHQGKERIEIRRDNFVMGQQNDWSTVFGEFAGEIKKRVKTDIYDVVVDDTSIATPTSRIVSEITLMDAMKSYFEYMVSTLCGIPQITLEGSRQDWALLKAKVKKLVEMNKGDRLKLSWWIDHLVPIVDKICEAGIDRRVDRKFWSGIYKYENPGSGSPSISGWITNFFPYIGESKNYFPNPVMNTSDVPQQICEVPFIWNYYGKHIPMNFYGGFLGAEFNRAEFTVSPAHFWSVNMKDEKQDEDEDEEEFNKMIEKLRK